MTASRQARLESLLHREIATTIQRELKDPRLGFITVTRVVMTGDLHQAKAYYTVLGDLKARRLAEQALEHARGFIQRQYAPAIKTRLVPQLVFAYDETENKRGDLVDLIRKARATDTDRGERPEPPSAEAVADAEKWTAPKLPSLHPEEERKRSAMEELIRKARSSDTDHGERPEPPSPEAAVDTEPSQAPSAPSAPPANQGS
jgi:ribosome-binding factor A